jgi:hypothetical protein
MNQSVSDFFAGGGKDARDCGTVNFHLPGSGILLEAHPVTEPQRLKLIQSNLRNNDVFARYVNGAKTPIPRLATDLPYFFRPHNTFLLCTYVHNKSPGPSCQVLVLKPG